MADATYIPAARPLTPRQESLRSRICTKPLSYLELDNNGWADAMLLQRQGLISFNERTHCFTTPILREEDENATS